jgi:Secretion system C-terminal sorting domain
MNVSHDKIIGTHLYKIYYSLLGLMLTINTFSQSSPAQKASPLPLSLTTFTAQLVNNRTILSWSTDMELNASHFVIQRSVDGTEYDDAGVVFTQGQGQLHRDYNFSDNINGISAKIIYYRLKLVDLNGKYNFSEVLLVRLISGVDALNLSIYPNPVETELRVTIPVSWQNKSVSYSIYNMQGNLMVERNRTNAGQTESLLVRDLPAGNYVIRTINGSQTAIKQFIKAN